jgi:hypothetical protein
METQQISKYDRQAEDFLKKTETTFKAEFLKHDFHFNEDKEKRDIYLITLKKGNREFKFKFGQSLYSSIKFKVIKGYLDNKTREHLKIKGYDFDYFQDFGVNTKEELNRLKPFFVGSGKFWEENKNFKIPSAYDVLACLQKYEVGSFKDFCDSFGYDEDSRKAEKTYNLVVEEYKNVCMLWNEKELEILQEIN